MTTANNPTNNLRAWQPSQSGNPSGRPKGTRDLAGYVLESTDGGKELVDALVSIARGVMPNVPVQEGSRSRKDQQVRPANQVKAIEMLLDRGFGRSPQQIDIAHNVSSRPMKLPRYQPISSTGYPESRPSFCQRQLAWIGLGCGMGYRSTISRTPGSCDSN